MEVSCRIQSPVYSSLCIFLSHHLTTLPLGNPSTKNNRFYLGQLNQTCEPIPEKRDLGHKKLFLPRIYRKFSTKRIKHVRCCSVFIYYKINFWSLWTLRHFRQWRASNHGYITISDLPRKSKRSKALLGRFLIISECLRRLSDSGGGGLWRYESRGAPMLHRQGSVAKLCRCNPVQYNGPIDNMPNRQLNKQKNNISNNQANNLNVFSPHCPTIPVEI